MQRVPPRSTTYLASTTALLALIAVLFACSRDSESTAPPQAATPPAARATIPTQGPRAGVTHRSLAELRRRNPMDWVGVAHNRAVDLFARELRGRKIRPGHLCEDLLRITASRKNDILPPGHREVSDADWKRGARMGAARVGCGKRAARSGDFSNAALAAPDVARPFLLAANAPRAPFEHEETIELLNATADAAANVDDEVALGDTLNAILDRANQLGDTAATQAVQAAISLASNSYSYWVSNGASMAGDIEDVYGPCLSANPDPDVGFQECVDGGDEWETGFRKPAAAPNTMFRTVASWRSPAPFCSLHRKAWVGADVATFVWGEVGALITMGPLGALLVIPVTTAAGATASAAAFVGDVVAWVLCKL